MVLRLALLLLVLAATGCRPRPETAQVSVFFVRSEGSAMRLAAVARTVARGGTEEMVTSALQALLDGPTAEERAQGLINSIPPGTRLREVRVRDGIVAVDFSSEVESGGGSASMLGRFWQIVYTATQFPDASRVRILIDGQQRRAMGGEGVIIEEPVTRPPAPPRF